MRVAKYISDLLYEYECVVVPGLGGFISNEVPAAINANHHSFNPPSKKIVFNPHLLINDGLLLNHIAKSEKISYTDARIRIEQFVLKCKFALDKGKRINFYRIGHLYKNNDHKIEFDPDKSRNYYAGSYGMSSFISPPIRRESSLRLDRKPSNRKSDNKGKSKEKETLSKKEKQPRYYSINLYGMLIILALALSFIFGFNGIKSFYQQNAAGIPFFYSTPNKYLLSHLHKVLFLWDETQGTQKDREQAGPADDHTYLYENAPKQEEADMQQDSREDLVKEPEEYETLDIVESPGAKASSPPPATAAKEEESAVTHKEESHYFIIAGSFENRTNASRLVNELQQKGYEALIVGQNKYGMYRVSLAGYPDAGLAEEQLAIIRREENPKAWIFKKPE
ncbi:MAG: SPOR domain-containing protein [Bacteroidota bacterium]|nr:SPOR domain-containing protein [Bacteroidota bacterium]